MIEDVVKKEIKDNLDLWSESYRNINSYSKTLAELDANKAVIKDKINNEQSEKERLENKISGIVESIEDSDENEKAIKDIFSSCLGDLMVERLFV